MTVGWSYENDYNDDGYNDNDYNDDDYNDDDYNDGDYNDDDYNGAARWIATRRWQGRLLFSGNCSTRPLRRAPPRWQEAWFKLEAALIAIV